MCTGRAAGDRLPTGMIKHPTAKMVVDGYLGLGEFTLQKGIEMAAKLSENSPAHQATTMSNAIKDPKGKSKSK